MSAPGPNELFPLIYNGGRGAKITNGSWTSGYRPYTFRCRMFDAALRDNYDDILFVASAGNSANDVPGKVMNTIGDPSSCKNILAGKFMFNVISALKLCLFIDIYRRLIT